MSILVFDIETIPDVEKGQKIYSLDGLSDTDIATAMLQLRKIKTGTEFLPHYLQKVVAISLVFWDENNLKVLSLGDVDNYDEKQLIKHFFSGIDKHGPVLVSWNGSGFDLPVLHYRALLHKISAPSYWESGDRIQGFRYNNYLNRYHYRHLDLMDVLSGYQGRACAPLDEIATMLGFPGKMGMNGSMVWQEYQNGNLKGIRDYCETDVLNTFCVYLRFELMRGLISEDEYENNISILKQYLQEQNKPHLTEFLENME